MNVLNCRKMKCCLTRERELDLAVNSSRSDQSGVETLDTISGHDYLSMEGKGENESM